MTKGCWGEVPVTILSFQVIFLLLSGPLNSTEEKFHFISQRSVVVQFKGAPEDLNLTALKLEDHLRLEHFHHLMSDFQSHLPKTPSLSSLPVKLRNRR